MNYIDLMLHRNKVGVLQQIDKTSAHFLLQSGVHYWAVCLLVTYLCPERETRTALAQFKVYCAILDVKRLQIDNRLSRTSLRFKIKQNILFVGGGEADGDLADRL